MSVHGSVSWIHFLWCFEESSNKTPILMNDAISRIIIS